MKNSRESWKDATRLLHPAFPSQLRGPEDLNSPLKLDVGKVMPGMPEAMERFKDAKRGGTYFRKVHENSREIEQRLAELEGAEDALVFASGMAATNCLLLEVIRHGYRIVSQPCVYGGTLGFMTKDLVDAGRQVWFVEDPLDRDEWCKAIRHDLTAAVWVEMPSNPRIELVDLDILAAICKEKGALLIVDNTFAPLFFKPIEHGADIVVRSCTKYENPGNTSMLGAVMGPAAIIDPIRNGRYERLGAMADSLSSWLTEFGVMYLDMRMTRQTENALRLAYFLQSHKKVARVYYPGLANDPQHALMKKYMPRGCGGILSFEIRGGYEEVQRFEESLRIFSHVISLGDIRSFFTYPAGTTHSKASEDVRKRLGITESLIRLSVGCEHPDDLVEDINQALAF